MISRLQRVIQQQGVSGLLRKVFRKVIYRRQTIVLLKHDLNLPHKPYKSSKRWSVKEFTRDDIQFCREHFNRFTADYLDLFELQFKSFAAFEANTNEVIAIAWYAPHDFFDQHYHQYTFKIQPHQAFQFAGEVSLPFRNSQISVHVMHAGWDYWKSLGKSEVFCSVDITNTPSLRLMFHLKWEEMGELVHFHRLLGFKWQTEEKYLGERFSQHKKKKRAD